MSRRGSVLEKIESIDMLRILEHGQRVKMVECTQKTHSVDVRADVAVVERMPLAHSCVNAVL